MPSRSAKATGVAATLAFIFILHLFFQPNFPYHQPGLVEVADESHLAGTQKQPQGLPVTNIPSEVGLDDKENHQTSATESNSGSILDQENSHEHEHEGPVPIPKYTKKISKPKLKPTIPKPPVAEPTTPDAPKPEEPKPEEPKPEEPKPEEPKPEATKPAKPETVISKLPAGFPRKVWQTGPKPVSQETRDRMETWMTHNPSFRHEFLSDDGGDAYVADKFRHRPDILKLYLNLRVPILKADILRYLILLADGGIWSDIDVSCLGSVDDWVPAEYGDRVSIVVGQEFDFPWRGEGSTLACQFTNWVFMAKPGSRHLQMVVDDIVIELGEIAREKNVTFQELKKSHLSDVVDVTGPKKMTVSLLKSLALDLNAPVDDRNVSTLKRPVLVGDLLVQPGAAFAAAQNGYPKDQGPNFVTHHYAGSWKHDDE